MNSWSDSLQQKQSKPSEANERYYFNTEERSKAYNPPPYVHCEYCGQVRPHKGFFMAGRVFWNPTGPSPCNCEQSQQAIEREQALLKAEQERLEAERRAEAQRKKVEAIMNASGLGRRFKNRRFDTFEVNADNHEAYTVAINFADNFQAFNGEGLEEKNGLLIMGTKGTGKTHLAAAIANKLMQEGTPVLFATMIDLLAKIKSSFDRSIDGASEDEIIGLYKTVDLLIIDDLGKEQPTDWALSKIYQIINARYEDYKPTILTSNYTLDELIRRMTPAHGDTQTAEATVDRIKEMTMQLNINGQSWRQ